MLQEEGKLEDDMQQPAKPAMHAKAGGAGGSIINILEVCESDFATNLAKVEMEEADASAEYEKTVQEIKVTRSVIKEQDVKYKTAEAVALDKAVSEYSSDRDTTLSEGSAVLEYYHKIQERCVAKPETYEERKLRRENEIKGLHDALELLNEQSANEQSALLQRRHRMRGAGSRNILQ